MDRLDIKVEMRNLDLKNRNFYDELTEEELKKFSTFMMIRWGATVTGIPEMQEYYLRSTNNKLNKYFFSINKAHDKLNWLAASTISPGLGVQSHQWLAAPKRTTNNGKIEKFLASIYPGLKSDDIALMGQMNSLSDVKQLALDMGMTKEQIKAALG